MYRIAFVMLFLSGLAYGQCIDTGGGYVTCTDTQGNTITGQQDGVFFNGFDQKGNVVNGTQNGPFLNLHSDPRPLPPSNYEDDDNGYWTGQPARVGDRTRQEFGQQEAWKHRLEDQIEASRAQQRRNEEALSEEYEAQRRDAIAHEEYLRRLNELARARAADAATTSFSNSLPPGYVILPPAQPTDDFRDPYLEAANLQNQPSQVVAAKPHDLTVIPSLDLSHEGNTRRVAKPASRCVYKSAMSDEEIALCKASAPR